MVVNSIQEIINIAKSRNGMLQDCEGAAILLDIVSLQFEDAIDEYATRMTPRAFFTCFATMSDVLPEWAIDRLIAEAHRFIPVIRLMIENSAIIDEYSRNALQKFYNPNSV